MVNKINLPQVALPIFVSFMFSHAFCNGNLGMTWDSNTSCMEELNANEKEWDMGIHTSTTTMPNIYEGVHGQILKQVMDINCLTWIFSLTLVKQTHLAHSFPPTHLPHTCVAPQLGTPISVQRGVMLWQHEVYIPGICGMRYTKNDLWVWGMKLMMWGHRNNVAPPNILQSNHKLHFHFWDCG
jgi:hypothetical protein